MHRTLTQPQRPASQANHSTAERRQQTEQSAPSLGGPCPIARGQCVPGPWFQLFEPHGFEWNVYDLPVPGLPPALEGFRIVHLSDFHLRPRWSSVYDGLLNRVEAAAPDLILCTGDFVENRHNCKPAIPFVHRLVAKLRARLGCFGILGNHDQHAVTGHLVGTNVTMIENQRRVLDVDGGAGRIELIGLPGHNRSELDPAFVRSLPPREPGVLRVVLSHYPDHIRRTRGLNADLFLTGHTHGGQVCLPGGWPIIRHDKLPRRLCKGIHRYEDTWLVVNKGFGFSGMPLRLFCPAEAIELRLTRD